MSSREIEVEITREAKSKEDKNFAPYAPEEQLGLYKIRRWTWREKQTAIMLASIPLNETKGLITLNLVDYQSEQMVSCVTPPEGLEWNRDHLDNTLDPDVGDALLAACQKVNGTTLSERTGFLEPSEPEKDTPG